MIEEVELILATVDDAELIHRMKQEAFLPLYENQGRKCRGNKDCP